MGRNTRTASAKSWILTSIRTIQPPRAPGTRSSHRSSPGSGFSQPIRRDVCGFGQASARRRLPTWRPPRQPGAGRGFAPRPLRYPANATATIRRRRPRGRRRPRSADTCQTRRGAPVGRPSRGRASSTEAESEARRRRAPPPAAARAVRRARRPRAWPGRATAPARPCAPRRGCRWRERLRSRRRMPEQQGDERDRAASARRPPRGVCPGTARRAPGAPEEHRHQRHEHSGEPAGVGGRAEASRGGRDRQGERPHGDPDRQPRGGRPQAAYRRPPRRPTSRSASCRCRPWSFVPQQARSTR